MLLANKIKLKIKFEVTYVFEVFLDDVMHIQFPFLPEDRRIPLGCARNHHGRDAAVSFELVYITMTTHLLGSATEKNTRRVEIKIFTSNKDIHF